MSEKTDYSANAGITLTADGHLYGSPGAVAGEIEKRIAEGKNCALLVTGMSMFPFLRNQRDKVMLAPLTDEIQRGDVLLYRRGDCCVLHRVHKIGSEENLIICGDAQQLLEVVPVNMVIARVVAVVRKSGRVITCSSFGWQACTRVWMGLYRIRPALLACLFLAARVKRLLWNKNRR